MLLISCENDRIFKPHQSQSQSILSTKIETSPKLGVWFEFHIAGLAPATLLPVSLVLGNINPITLATSIWTYTGAKINTV